MFYAYIKLRKQMHSPLNLYAIAVVYAGNQ